MSVSFAAQATEVICISSGSGSPCEPLHHSSGEAIQDEDADGGAADPPGLSFKERARERSTKGKWQSQIWPRSRRDEPRGAASFPEDPSLAPGVERRLVTFPFPILGDGHHIVRVQLHADGVLDIPQKI